MKRRGFLQMIGIAPIAKAIPLDWDKISEKIKALNEKVVIPKPGKIEGPRFSHSTELFFDGLKVSDNVESISTAIYRDQIDMTSIDDPNKKFIAGPSHQTITMKFTSWFAFHSWLEGGKEIDVLLNMIDNSDLKCTSVKFRAFITGLSTSHDMRCKLPFITADFSVSGPAIFSGE
jgi:hypothetical protein